MFSGLGEAPCRNIIKYFYKRRKIIDNDIDYFAKYLGSDFKLFLKT